MIWALGQLGPDETSPPPQCPPPESPPVSPFSSPSTDSQTSFETLPQVFKQTTLPPPVFFLPWICPSGNGTETSSAHSIDRTDQTTLLSPRADGDVDVPFRIVDLPREIRDMIWRYALVRPKIHIAFSPTSNFPASGPAVNRRSKLTIRQHKYHDHPVATEGSYHYWHISENSNIGEPGIDLSLFLTSFWVYAECTEVFYSQNVFAFGDDCSTPKASRVSGGIATIYAFLEDRSPTVKGYIRHVEINALYGCASSTFHEGEYGFQSALRAMSDLRLDTLSLNLSYIQLSSFTDAWRRQPLHQVRARLELTVSTLNFRLPQVTHNMVMSCQELMGLRDLMINDGRQISVDAVVFRPSKGMPHAAKWNLHEPLPDGRSYSHSVMTLVENFQQGKTRGQPAAGAVLSGSHSGMENQTVHLTDASCMRVTDLPDWEEWVRSVQRENSNITRELQASLKAPL